MIDRKPTEADTESKCTHLDQVHAVEPGSTGCEECLQTGDSWVHLRVCMVCGHVGCCDESKNKHATRHFHATTHPIIRSLEPGEEWLWCYADQTVIYQASNGPGDVRIATTRQFLEKLPLFAGLPEREMELLVRMAEPATIKTGQVLMEEGTPGDALYIIIDGEFEVTKHSGKQRLVLGVRKTGEVLGEMSLIEQVPRMATVRALRDSQVLGISQGGFHQLLAGNPSAVNAILRTFITRLRSTETLLVQNEKMASLGTLAAGLAHELNNPAAAVRRSADQLREVFAEWQRLAAEIDLLDLSPAQSQTLAALRTGMEARGSNTPRLDPLTRSDREDELQTWLEDHDIDKAWEFAPVLVSFGWQREELDELASTFAGEQLPVIVRWLAAGNSAFSLLGEVSQAATRISEIVKAVKTYSYLDQAPIQEVDVHEGLENTLVILRHKLKNVTIHREYSTTLPRIDAYASELNQVWTNLIDNAIDAMKGEGEITLRTYARPDSVVVEIIDSGPGIPQEVQQRIWEPFFTTKAPGVGTGLGLHIVYNIIADKHRGQVQVESRPGMTCFQVALPVRLARE
ncbi:MAG: ATP-binding protein [Chloroflexota bacterium]|nr:ATP-binding protein [Chloroflexota bacterium]